MALCIDQVEMCCHALGSINTVMERSAFPGCQRSMMQKGNAMIDNVARIARQNHFSRECAYKIIAILNRINRMYPMYPRCNMSKTDVSASERHGMHLTPNRFPTSRLWGITSTRSSRG